MPVYELRGNGLRVHFAALKNALIDVTKAPKPQSDNVDGALEDALALRIISMIKENPTISQDGLAEKLDTTRRTVQRKMDALKVAGRIERIGGK